MAQVMVFYSDLSWKDADFQLDPMELGRELTVLLGHIPLAQRDVMHAARVRSGALASIGACDDSQELFPYVLPHAIVIVLGFNMCAVAVFHHSIDRVVRFKAYCAIVCLALEFVERIQSC